MMEGVEFDGLYIPFQSKTFHFFGLGTPHMEVGKATSNGNLSSGYGQVLPQHS